MDRHAFLVGTGAVLIAAPRTADAQPAERGTKAFLGGMSNLGWLE